MTAKITNSLAGLDEHVTIKKMETSAGLCKLHITFPEGERVCPYGSPEKYGVSTVNCGVFIFFTTLCLSSPAFYGDA